MNFHISRRKLSPIGRSHIREMFSKWKLQNADKVISDIDDWVRDWARQRPQAPANWVRDDIQRLRKALGKMREETLLLLHDAYLNAYPLPASGRTHVLETLSASTGKGSRKRLARGTLYADRLLHQTGQTHLMRICQTTNVVVPIVVHELIERLLNACELAATWKPRKGAQPPLARVYLATWLAMSFEHRTGETPSGSSGPFAEFLGAVLHDVAGELLGGKHRKLIEDALGYKALLDAYPIEQISRMEEHAKNAEGPRATDVARSLLVILARQEIMPEFLRLQYSSTAR